MGFKITIEGRKSLQSIQHEFADKLSPQVIRTTTARALNITANRVKKMAMKEVTKEYTVNNKYLNRMADVTKPAAGKVDGLYAEISYSFKTVPMVGFNFKESKSRTGKKGNGFIMIEIKKSKNQILKHAFVASMVSGHTGIYAAGRYKGSHFIYNKERTATGKQKITEMKTSSPFGMSTNKDVQGRTTTYVEKNLPGRLRALLQQKVDRLTK